MFSQINLDSVVPSWN